MSEQLGNIIQKIEKYEKVIMSEKEFIKAPRSYISDMTTIDVNGEITEYMKAIAVRNAQIIVDLNNKVESLRKRMEGLRPIQGLEERNYIEEGIVGTNDTVSTLKDISSYIRILENSLFEDDTLKIMETVSYEDIVRLKLYFLNRVKKLNQQIRNMVIMDPTVDIGSLQEQIAQYELTIEYLNQLNSEEVLEKKDDSALSNIILVPEFKNRNSYLYGDVLKLLDNRKEIKIALDKIFDGYFLKTKDTRIIEHYREQKMYEYKHPNGIRILYIVNGGYIFICSLFYKDKQKSIRISNYYEEALNRYLGCIEYFKNNMREADFYIEQDEYIGALNSILEQGLSLQKVGGE